MNQLAVRVLTGLLMQGEFVGYDEPKSIRYWFGKLPTKELTLEDVVNYIKRLVRKCKAYDAGNLAQILEGDIFSNYIRYYSSTGGRLGCLFTLLIKYGNEECFKKAEELLLLLYETVKTSNDFEPEDVAVDH